jgi:succinate dehydrogenase / fumarate reductase, cytochrome b subunit
VVAITGVLLIGFVIAHLIGNLQFFWGPKVINEYGTHLRELPFGLLWVMRLGLLGIVLAHIITTIILVVENRKARGTPYAFKASVQAKLATRLMAVSGIILLSYIVFHLMHFTTHNVNTDFAKWHYVDPNDANHYEHHDVYRMLVSGFSNIGISLFYIVAMVLLASHLSHGAASLFQTLGLRTKKTAVMLGVGAQVFAWALCAGYISIPVAVLVGAYDKAYIAQASSGKVAQADTSCCDPEPDSAKPAVAPKTATAAVLPLKVEGKGGN